MSITSLRFAVRFELQPHERRLLVDGKPAALGARALGARASMALRPATPIEPYADLLDELDMVLLMTVEPGFGGQSFLDVVLPKLRRTRALLDARGGDIWLQVDGGISAETIERCAEAGADTFVAGSAVYSAADPDVVVRALKATAESVTTGN